jgi:hypothetical protein
MGRQFWECDRCERHFSFDVSSNRLVGFLHKHGVDYFMHNGQTPDERQILDFCDTCIEIVRDSFHNFDEEHSNELD